MATKQISLTRTDEPEAVNYDRNEWDIECPDCRTNVSASKGTHSCEGLRVYGWKCASCNNVFPAHCHGPTAPSFNDRMVGVEADFRDGSSRYVPTIKSSVSEEVDR